MPPLTPMPASGNLTSPAQTSVATANGLHLISGTGLLVVAPTLIEHGLAGKLTGAMLFSVLGVAAVGFWAAGAISKQYGRAMLANFVVLWIALCISVFLQGGVTSYAMPPLLMVGPVLLLAGCWALGRWLTVLSIVSVAGAQYTYLNGWNTFVAIPVHDVQLIAALFAVAGLSRAGVLGARASRAREVSARPRSAQVSALTAATVETPAGPVPQPTARIETPELPEPSAPSRPVPIARRVREPGSSLSIMLVDDNHNFLEVYKLTLEDQNIAVSAFSSPESAMAAAQTTDFDAIVTDLNFGEVSKVDGIELTKRLRANGSVTCPILGITGNVGYNVEQDWLGAGAIKILTKPFVSGILVSAIREAVHGTARGA